MKRKKSTGLEIAKETLRSLTARKLRGVHGGGAKTDTVCGDGCAPTKGSCACASYDCTEGEYTCVYCVETDRC